MAIVIEEEKGKTGAVSVFIWLVIIGIIFAIAYYLFFKKPDLIPLIKVPSNFQSTDQLKNITLQPNDVIENPQFKALQKYINFEVADPRGGRPNPFLGL